MKILELYDFFVNDFENAQNAKNLSKNTNYTYYRIISSFREFLVDNVENKQISKIVDINNSFLASYVAFLEESGLSPVTRKLHINVLKQFLWYIADYDVKLYGVLRAKVTGVKIKIPEREVETFNDNDQAKIKSLIAKFDKTKTFMNHRLSLILKLLLFHGIRIDELINLKWSDVEEVDDDEVGCVYRLRYIGKGDKERTLEFPTVFVDDNFAVIKKAVKSDYVVCSKTGTKSFRNSIYSSIRKLLEEQGIKHVYLHKFRHTFGQNKVNEDVNISTITELMGHTNPMVTHKFYLRNNKKAKRKAILDGLPK